MVAFLTSDDPITLIALSLWQNVQDGMDEADYLAAYDELAANLGVLFPIPWTHAAMLAATDPPDPSGGGTNPSALAAWVSGI